MRKSSAFALLLLALSAADVQAVEIKNIRATYGPFGARRPDNKFAPGDVYMLNFDIADLKIDRKVGLVKYVLSFDVIDPKGKPLPIPDKDKIAKKGLIMGLGGNNVPDSIKVVLGVDQAPGKYKVVVTVTDGETNASKQLVHEVELMPVDFAIIQVLAPAVGFTGQDYNLVYGLVGMARDGKKMPKVTITMRVYDDGGKLVWAEPLTSRLPDDLPENVRPNVPKIELFPMESPMFLNRAGRFTVQIEARDELSNKTARLSYTLTVLDPSGK